MTLHAWLNPESFLKSPGQELSEYIVFSYGEAILANLDLRERCGSSFVSKVDENLTFVYVVIFLIASFQVILVKSKGLLSKIYIFQILFSERQFIFFIFKGSSHRLGYSK